jgi:tRNA dimethylallyltransferase
MHDALPLIAVVGATASGKSDLAVDLSLQIGGEVVNCDAMQLYRGMDIGTAKLSVAQRRGVRHHLLDVLDVTEPASVAQFQGWARAAIAEIWARGHVPVLVGGSGLYVRAVVDEIEFPGTDPAVRAELQAELADLGADAMHQRLRRVDPAAAELILPTNARRIVRALEVVQITGAPFRASLPAARYWHQPTVQVAPDVARPELDARVEARVERMWADGFVDEVRRLAEVGLRDAPTASRALGYAQVLRFIDGEWTEQQARERTVAATRRFIRRQDQWFRRDPRVRWLTSDEVGAGLRGSTVLPSDGSLRP